jgi:hypothetical protein
VNDPRQPECGWQEGSAAFAGAILIERSGNRLVNEPAIRAQPNAHRLRMAPGCSEDRKEITEQHPSRLKLVQGTVYSFSQSLAGRILAWRFQLLPNHVSSRSDLETRIRVMHQMMPTEPAGPFC